MNPLEELSQSRHHFELFGIPVRFTLDRSSFERRYLELTRMTHPDLAGEDQQLEAMTLSARVNEAYSVLGDDFQRAEYVLALAGGDTQGEVSPEVMERIFELREAAEHGDTHARSEAQSWLSEIMSELGRRLDAADTGERPRELLAIARYLRKIAQP